jgi:maltooligosyltrehalose trehalohydrolase
MKRSHAMPFGTVLRAGGGVDFRLWAPGAHAVSLLLEDSGTMLVPMQASRDGWFEVACAQAHTGSRYRFEVDGSMHVPDPASRFNPQGVHGPSEVCDPLGFSWSDAPWTGRPWSEAVIYELHVGTFTPQGTFAGVEERLDYLQSLGVTALELMPIAAFPGSRNWGYDGVLPYAPASVYGRPEDLKRLVESAHQRGLMVLLDVVYNHFGPDGNYLHAYAPPFFSRKHPTPWGEAIGFDGPRSRTVRDFFLHNALYWLEEFHLDGLRLDSVHTIHDESRPHFLEELATAVSAGPGRMQPVHLVLENDRNEARRLARHPHDQGCFTAQWNDDFHHALHLLTTGEADGYYADYAEDPAAHLGRALTEGFSYQGQASAFRKGAPRGEPSAGLPLGAFLNFLQTHDQVGNRALGERLTLLASPEALRMATAILLLAPSPPLLFMGQEFGEVRPFAYFCDFPDELSEAVRKGRSNEFSSFTAFSDPGATVHIPDPCAEETFTLSRLDWQALALPTHREWLALHRALLTLRRREIVPRLRDGTGKPCAASRLGRSGLACSWMLGDGSRLELLANPGPEACPCPAIPVGRLIFATPEEPHPGDPLLPWAAWWFLASARGTA